MNNPFQQQDGGLNSSINNPFDADPTSARNRFPDISSPAFEQGQWSSNGTPGIYSGYNTQQQQQPAQTFSNYQPSAFNGAPQPSNQMYSSFSTSAGSYPTPTYNNAGFAGGVGSGGAYSGALSGPSLAYGNTYSPYSNPGTSGPMMSPSFGQSSSSSYLGGLASTQPQNHTLNSQLSQFDPLSPSSAGPKSPSYYTNPLLTKPMSTFSSSRLDLQDELDPGEIIWHPRSSPSIQMVTGFNGQTTIQVPIRPHNYQPTDHPRHVTSQHRAELEQWDQYGWRQSLNAFESLRLAWESLRDDITRAGDIPTGPMERAVLAKVRFVVN